MKTAVTWAAGLILATALAGAGAGVAACADGAPVGETPIPATRPASVPASAKPGTTPAPRALTRQQQIEWTDKARQKMDLCLNVVGVPMDPIVEDEGPLRSAPARFPNERAPAMVLSTLMLSTWQTYVGGTHLFPRLLRYTSLSLTEANALADILLAGGAFAVLHANADREPNRARVVLTVTADSLAFTMDLGWGEPMLRRLAALRGALDKDGPAAADMDLWARRFEPYRQWEAASTQPAGGLDARLESLESAWRDDILAATSRVELRKTALKRPSLKDWPAIPPEALREPNVLGPRWRFDPRYGHVSHGIWTFAYLGREDDKEPGVVLELYRTTQEAREALLGQVFNYQAPDQIILPGYQVTLAARASIGDLYTGRFVRANVLVRFVNTAPAQAAEKAKEIDQAILKLAQAAADRAAASRPTSQPAADLNAMAKLLGEKLGGTWEKTTWKNRPAPGRDVEFLKGTIAADANVAWNNGRAPVHVYAFPPTGEHRKTLESIYEVMQAPFAIVGVSPAATAVAWADPNSASLVKLREALGMKLPAEAGKWMGEMQAEGPATKPASGVAK